MKTQNPPTPNDNFTKVSALLTALTEIALNKRCADQLGKCLAEIGEQASEKQLEVFLKAVSKVVK